MQIAQILLQNNGMISCSYLQTEVRNFLRLMLVVLDRTFHITFTVCFIFIYDERTLTIQIYMNQKQLSILLQLLKRKQQLPGTLSSVLPHNVFNMYLILLRFVNEFNRHYRIKSIFFYSLTRSLQLTTRSLGGADSVRHSILMCFIIAAFITL